MDPKLTILFMLIASIIGLSHVSDMSFGRMRRLLPSTRLRDLVPGPWETLGSFCPDRGQTLTICHDQRLTCPHHSLRRRRRFS